MLSQTHQFLHRSSRKVHSLETNRFLHSRDFDRFRKLSYYNDKYSSRWQMQENDVIKGEVSCAPNSRNNRDLDIVFDYQIEGSNSSSGQMVYKMYVHLL